MAWLVNGAEEGLLLSRMKMNRQKLSLLIAIGHSAKFVVGAAVVLLFSATAVGNGPLALNATEGSVVVTNSLLFTDPGRSILWKTLRSGEIDIPVEWPTDAATARLTISGRGFNTLTYAVSPPDEVCHVSLTLPDAESRETLLAFELKYFKSNGAEIEGAAKNVSLGFVCGLGNGASIRCDSDGEMSGKWTQIPSRHAVLPLPEKVENVALDGVSALCVDAPGWCQVGPVVPGWHTLSAVTNGVAFGGMFVRIAPGTLITIP